MTIKTGTYSYRFITFGSLRFGSSISLLGGHIWLGCEFCLSFAPCFFFLKVCNDFFLRFSDYFTLLATLQGLLNDLSLKIFLSKDSPPLGMSGCSEMETIVSSCQSSTGRTVLETFSSKSSLAAKARTSALVGGQHGSETVERRDDSLAKGCGAAGTVSGIVGRTAAHTPRIVAP